MRTKKLSTLIGAIVMSGAASTLAASAAGATIAPNSNGVGVCFSQLAIDPSIIGVTRFGDGIKTFAAPGSPGSDIPANLAGDRNACGEPPGPGHL